MYQKLFQINLLLFLGLFTLAGIMFLFQGLTAMFLHLLSDSDGIGAWRGGVSGGFVRIILFDFPIVVVGIYLIWRRRKLRQ
jgi:hypothetical protein